MKLVVALAMASLAFLVASAAAAPSDNWLEYFGDPQSDAGSAPDLAQIFIGGSDDGAATFHIWARIPPGDTTSTITVFIDADDNPSTGDAVHAGADYSLVAFHGGRSFDFTRWSSGRWVSASAPPMFASYRNPFLDFYVSRALLGGAAAINVMVESSAGTQHDRLPDTGTIHYGLTPLVLAISKFSATRSPRGERLELGVTRSDTGGALTGQPPYCHGRVGGKIVFASVLDSGKPAKPAFCAWKFSKAMVGKKARLTITSPYASRKVSRSVSLTVR
jgi:hypothetical protein